MAKFVIIFDDTMSKEGIHLTNYCKLLSDLTTNENFKKGYHRVQLKHFKRAMGNVREQYLFSVTNVWENVEEIIEILIEIAKQNKLTYKEFVIYIARAI